jgi:PP-loop superfamily ATP-utilizing enzyme
MRQISQYLKQIGYVFVTLDLEGYRSGTFDRRESEGT